MTKKLNKIKIWDSLKGKIMTFVSGFGRTCIFEENFNSIITRRKDYWWLLFIAYYQLFIDMFVWKKSRNAWIRYLSTFIIFRFISSKQRSNSRTNPEKTSGSLRAHSRFRLNGDIWYIVCLTLETYPYTYFLSVIPSHVNVYI